MTPPSVDARPPEGTDVKVSSTRRDKDGDGVVVACDDLGIRIGIKQASTVRTRFYPWGQIAFVEWDA